MISGFERYYQIARCFRDEDLRADRVQEITQLDLEMAFPDRELIFALMERVFSAVWRECIDATLETPFPRLTFAEAEARYGTDKPDLRFGLELEDATEVTRASAFGVFANAPAVRFLRVPGELSRAELARLEEAAKLWGAKGLAYIVYGADGEPRSPIVKFLSEPELELFRSDPGTTVLFGADAPKAVARVLGNLRVQLGEELGLIDRDALAAGLDRRLPDVRLGRGRTGVDREPPPVHGARRRSPSRCSRATRARRSRRPTTSSSTGPSSGAARSGSTAPSSSRRSSTSCASRARSSGRGSASSSTRSGWARRLTAGSRRGWTARRCSWPASRTCAT